jgi:hypothetical protein
MIRNNEFERTRKEAIVSRFEVLFIKHPVGNEVVKVCIMDVSVEIRTRYIQNMLQAVPLELVC